MARGFHFFDWRAVYRVALIHISDLVIVVKWVRDGGQAAPLCWVFALCDYSAGAQFASV